MNYRQFLQDYLSKPYKVFFSQYFEQIPSGIRIQELIAEAARQNLLSKFVDQETEIEKVHLLLRSEDGFSSAIAEEHGLIWMEVFPTLEAGVFCKLDSILNSLGCTAADSQIEEKARK